MLTTPPMDPRRKDAMTRYLQREAATTLQATSKQRTPRRLSLIGASAGLAAAVAVAVVITHGTELGQRGPAMGLVAYSLPVPTEAPTNCDEQSAFSYPAFEKVPELLHLLPEAPPETVLAGAIVEVTACNRGAWPAASFLRLAPDRGRAEKALTVWGPNAAGLPMDLRDGEQGVRITEVAGQPARVRVTDWGVVQSWSTGSEHWVITAAGMDPRTVAQVAEHVVLNDGIEGLAQQLPDMENIALPPEPKGAVATYTVRYEVPGANVEGSQDFDAPGMHIQVGPGLTPWSAALSTGPLEDQGIFDINGTLGTGVSNGGVPGGVAWQITPDLTATVFGTASRDSTGYRDLVPLMRTLQPVTPDDPRFADPAVDTRAGG
ncbi:hypothetical protein CLV92_1052 [Kineococcus xinjiangensis]|uniref:Uncharacterized protein n=1 Tax=Kineococcus xinjiangensis TaxID=512762 RepID=A0A2S6INX7_9ACTN|nr:hypothetical protein [Kineococcus xinjiangensis]PPK95908.1 hypothetical protein CLV92_1052 [Kineococcus xinjiangensis]